MILENNISKFEEFILSETLSEKEIDALLVLASIRSYTKKEVVYFPEDDADKIYIIKSGKIKISKYSETGKELILSIYSPGEIFGEHSIVSQQKRDELAECLEDSEIYSIKTEDFLSVTKKNVAFTLSIAQLISGRLKKIQKRLEALYFKNTEERIKSFIKDMADEYGRKLITGDEIEIKLNLKHEDIAKLTATTRQSVTTILSQLEKDGVILYDRHRILVKKLKQL